MDTLRPLLSQYETAVTDLNKAIDQATTANNLLVVAKAEVSKNKYKLDLIKEQVMCEKKLIDAAR